MIKYLGGALLIVAGYLLGNSLYGIYLDRVKLLERFRDFLVLCETEIIFYKSEISVIIDKFYNKSNKYDNFIFGEKRNNFFVSKEIEKFVKEFFYTITSLDSESQKGYFAETQKNINVLLEKSKNELCVKGKMLKKLVPITTIGIFILTL